MQKKTFTKWVNSHLARVGCHIGDLYTDLRDGFVLTRLLEVLSGEQLVRGPEGVGKGGRPGVSGWASVYRARLMDGWSLLERLSGLEAPHSGGRGHGTRLSLVGKSLGSGLEQRWDSV